MDRSLTDRVAENRLVSRWADLLPRSPAQTLGIHEADAELLPWPSDDGALLALNVDALSEEIATGLYDTCTAGYVAVIGALSDLAAVAADPLGVLLAVTLPPGDVHRVQTEIARGARGACETAGTWVLGGDTSTGERVAITCTAVGRVPRGAALSRRGARPGDLILTTGPAGAGAAHAAGALLGRREAAAPAAFAPRAHLAAGRCLRGLATSCMDTSDGMLAAVDQLTRVNGVGAMLVLEDALVPSAHALAEATGLPRWAVIACPHGDYELVFTVPPERRDAVRDRFATAGLEPPLVVGVVGDHGGVRVRARTLPTAQIRDLAALAGVDPRRYLEALRGLARG